MKTAQLTLSVLLTLSTIGSPALAANRKRILEPPLPAATLALVRQKMAVHSKQMTELVWSVVFMDYRETERLATVMLSSARIGKPGVDSDASELATPLPPLFFTLQDELRTRARILLNAAQTRDSEATARAFGQVTETCAACHSTYSNAR